MPVGELSDPALAFRLGLLLTLLLGMSGRAQAERLPIRTYTTTDGLAGDGINRIVRDSRGFLWFCTSEGLSRFDGYKFTNYGTAQGLPHRTVSDLIETRSGDYWVAVAGELCRFKPDPSPQSEAKFVVFHLGNDDDDINALFEDQAGTIWCAKGDGLHRVDSVNGQWTFSIVDLGRPPNSDPNVVSIVEDRRGDLWINTGSGLYRRRADGMVDRYAAEQGVPRPYGGPLFADREGRIWLGAIGKGLGLYQIVPDPAPNRSVVSQAYTTKDGLGKNRISCMSQSSDGRLWVGTGGDLNEFLPTADRDGRQFRSYASANGIRDVTSIGEDRDGNLWIGTGTNGAMKIASNGFTPFSEADGLGGTRISQISETGAAELCVFSGGNEEMFINRFDGGTFTALQLALPKGIASWSWGWYQNMLQDRAGEWWVSTGQGLVRYPKLRNLEQLRNARPRAIYTTRDGLGGNAAFRIFEDSRGDIWVGTIDAGPSALNRWERSTGKFHPYFKEDGVPPAAPTAFCEDASGSLWIGFYVGGVARYRDGHFTLFTTADGLPAGFIGALYIDNAGRLWIATTEGGVARVDDPGADSPRFVTYTTADGLSSNHATSVTEDRWGRIYVGTGCGLDRLDPTTGHIKHYTTADGLANNYVNVSFRDLNGTLWFGTLDGVSRFIPEPDRPELPPPILINGLRVAGVQQPISELGETNLSGFKLGASQNDLQIDFFAMGFGSGEVLRYRYKLEGADQDWGPLTDQRRVNYANLSPGSYHFLVQAVSADGLVSPSPASIAFTIRPPIWQRWWFLALVALLVGMIVYLLYRYRVSRLIELERVRTRIATDLHDDIGSSLSQVSVLSEVIRRRVGAETNVSEPLSMIAGLSRDLVDSMNDIVWAINPNRDHLSDLTQRMRRFASDVLTARDIEFNFTAPDPQHNIRLGADMRREVFLIFKESVNNIVRHSASTEADIEFRIESGWLDLKIRDNGKGFDADREGEGNGLVNMRKRADRIGGAFEVSSEKARGTLIWLKAPIARRGWMN